MRKNQPLVGQTDDDLAKGRAVSEEWTRCVRTGIRSQAVGR